MVCGIRHHDRGDAAGPSLDERVAVLHVLRTVRPLAHTDKYRRWDMSLCVGLDRQTQPEVLSA